jgi:beta-lactam-binding protein with PASTA domain
MTGAGYLLAAVVLFPAPLLPNERSVPRLRGTVALTVSEGPPRVAVPGVDGLDPDLAQRLLRGAGLRVELVDSVPGTLPAGVAVGTSPPARDSAQAGSALVLHLSKGPK